MPVTYLPSGHATDSQCRAHNTEKHLSGDAFSCGNVWLALAKLHLLSTSKLCAEEATAMPEILKKYCKPSLTQRDHVAT